MKLSELDNLVSSFDFTATLGLGLSPKPLIF